MIIINQLRFKSYKYRLHYPVTLSFRFYPGPIPVIKHATNINKFIHRVLYPFYNNKIYNKLYLSKKEDVINSLVEHSQHFHNTYDFATSLRKLWSNDNYLNSYPLKEETKSILNSFIYSLKNNKPAILKGISGIAELPQFFIQDVELISEILIKTMINLFGGKIITCNEDLISRVEQILQPVKFIDNKYYYPSIQHILNSILPLNRVKIELIAKINDDVISYSAYTGDTANIQLVVESFVIKFTLTDYIKLNKNRSKFIMQNPDNPLGDHIQYKSLAYEQMKQSVPDLRESSKNMNLSEINSTALITVPQFWLKFWDAKLIGDPVNKLSLSRGHLSLVTSLDNSNKTFLMKQSVGDYGGSNKQKRDTQQISEKQFLDNKTALSQFTPILNSNMSIENKFIQFTKLQHAINSDPNVSLVCSYIAKPPVDYDYEIFYKMHLEGKLDRSLIIKEIQLNKYKLFPNQCQYVDVIQWEKTINVIIKALPKDISATLELNYHKVKALEIW